MIANIVDNRQQKYRWKRVNAVIESTWHDNGCPDADQAEQTGDFDEDYDDRKGISVSEAIAWAGTSEAAVTLYLYDEGTGIE